MIKRSSEVYLLAWAGALILVCLYPITLFEHSLKWDALDITLPWRYFSCDALRQGILPLWNPFQFQGFAHGSEPQTWYPLALILGMAKGYDMYCLNLEYLLHLVIAMWGFVRLAKANGISSLAGTIGGLSFALSGFFIGNSQHFGWIVAGAWLPHIIASYQQFLVVKHWRNFIPLVLAGFMLLTGGYIAFTLILIYVLLGMTLLLGLKGKIGINKIILRRGLVLLVTLAATGGVVLVGWWDLAQHISRADGLSGAEALVGSSYFKHLLSLLWPAATIHETWEFWQGDQSLINHYIGIPALVFALTTAGGFRKNAVVRSLWILLLAALLLSMGQELPVRRWANVLPGFSLFRFPSLFRYFTLLLLCLLASIGFEQLVKDRSPVLLWRSLFGVAICYFIGGLITSSAGFGHHNLEASIYTSSFQGLLILLATYLLWISSQNLRQRHWVILTLIGLDLFVFIQLNGPTSVLSAKPFGMLQSTMRQLPKGYPHPPLQDAVISNPDKSLQKGSIYRNTNTLYKRMGWDGYTPYQYQRFIDLENSGLHRSTLLGGPFLLSPLQKTASGSDFHRAENDLNLVDKCLQVVDFTPNEIVVSSTTKHPRLLVYNQNFHPEWRAFIDDREVTIHKAEINLMAVHLPPGAHEVRFSFWPGSLVNALYISSFLFFGLLLVFIAQYRSGWVLAGVLVVSAGILLVQTYFQDRSEIDPPMPSLYNEYHQITSVHVDDTEFIRDRFLDKGDFDRYRQIRHDYLDLPFFDNSLGNAFEPPSMSDASWTALCTFGTKAKDWQHSRINIEVDEMSNSYQEHTDLEYGATYDHKFRSAGVKELSMQLNTRGEVPATAQLVASVTEPDGRRQMKIYRLTSSSYTWSQRNFTHTFEVKPGSILKVYVWNPKLASFGTDNLSLLIEDVLE